jgi:hypothetical protein
MERGKTRAWLLFGSALSYRALFFSAFVVTPFFSLFWLP